MRSRSKARWSRSTEKATMISVDRGRCRRDRSAWRSRPRATLAIVEAEVVVPS
jgi:hypothetical protein